MPKPLSPSRPPSPRRLRLLALSALLLALVVSLALPHVRAESQEAEVRSTLPPHVEHCLRLFEDSTPPTGLSTCLRLVP